MGAHGSRTLRRTTAPDRRARAVYDRSGAAAPGWIAYELEVQA
jgi:hypothetical protein